MNCVFRSGIGHRIAEEYHAFFALLIFGRGPPPAKAPYRKYGIGRIFLEKTGE